MYSQMFHKLEHFLDLPDILVLMPHADFSTRDFIQSVKMRFPCVTRVSRAAKPATTKRPAVPATGARRIP
jgi:hypothetical protein